MNYEPMIEQIKLDEGLRLRMYKCTADKWTVGYGFNLDANPITEDIAHQLLILILSDVEDSLFKHGLLGPEHNDARKAVMLNMAYQMGVNGLLGFKKAIKAYRELDYKTASAEMLNSKYAKIDTPSRARKMAEQMLTGEFQ